VIDLHGHMCFGVDDGPQTPAEARALAEALVAAGVTTFACTSHVRPDKGWVNDARVFASNHAALEPVICDLSLRVVSAAEHYIHDDVFGDADFAQRLVPYGSSRWVLIETPYIGKPAGLLPLLRRVRLAGFKVLLAHVERFPYLHNDNALLEQLLDAGHLFQVNLGSVAGAYGSEQKRSAEKLLDADMVAVLAGDCHRAHDVGDNIIAGRAAVLKKYGKQNGTAMLQRLTIDAPQKILDDASSQKVWP
jgi:protein-tyrosine phosphatase